MNSTDELEKKIKYVFKNKNILENALTHSSYANEVLKDRLKGNERLEFLGDTVLDTVIGVSLFHLLPDKDEGTLTKLKAEIVCESSLARAAKDMGLSELLRLSAGEERGGGRRRESLLADAAEALIGAVFLDGGTEAARAVIMTVMEDIVQDALNGRLSADYKTDFQQFIQKQYKNSDSIIHYELISESGPDHAKEFTVTVSVNSEVLGTGTGSTKKSAQQQAAKAALALLKERQQQ